MKFNIKTPKNCRINSTVFIFGLLKFLQALYRPIFFLLPPSVAVYLMRFGAETVYQIARRTSLKGIAAKNYKMVFPTADTNMLAEKLLRNISYSIFEMLCLPYFRAAHVKRISKFVGLENFEAAMAERKGALVILMHTGNYEIVPFLLAQRSYHVTSILKAPSDDPLYKFINGIRNYKGAHLINILEENMYREALQALAHNRCVGILLDTGASESRHEFISFLGQKVPVATGWLALAQRSGAPVVPCLVKREGKNNVVEFGAPFKVDSENKDQAMEMTRQHFEKFIQAHPEQWAIFLNEFEVKRMLGK